MIKVKNKFEKVFQKEIKKQLKIEYGNKKLDVFRIWISQFNSEIIKNLEKWYNLTYFDVNDKVSKQPFKDWNRYFTQEIFLRNYEYLSEPWDIRHVFNRFNM